MIRKCLAVGIILLFLGTCVVPVVAQDTNAIPFLSKIRTMTPCSYSSAETELKYYEEEGLSTVVGVCADSIWKSAIRLTQDEMAAYADWTMTKVNVAFPAFDNCPWIVIKIYIYDKGNVSTKPGSLIVNDTTYTLDTAGVTTVPLVSPVNLSGHEELWVAVEWYDIGYGVGACYAWLDTLTRPHVPLKGDFIYLNNEWTEIYNSGPDFDGNWGIGAIVEGLYPTEVSIGNIKGPMGITANVSNRGIMEAVNVSWSIGVTGGLFHTVTVLETGMLSGIGIGSSVEIETGIFFGFGKIQITVAAKAKNAPEAMETKTAFLLGPFVVGIK